MNDKYTPVHNEVLEALYRVNLTGYEVRVLFCIWRRTYGFADGKGGRLKVNTFSLDLLSELTGINHRNVCRSLNSLKEKKLIVRNGSVTGFSKEFMKGVTSETPPSDISDTGTVTSETLEVVTSETPLLKKYINKTLKKDKDTSVSFGKPEINALMEILKSAKGDTTKLQLQRFAAQRLIKKHGTEQVAKVFKWALALRGTQYAPVVTNLMALEKKWADLEAYAVRSKGERSKRGIDATNL